MPYQRPDGKASLHLAVRPDLAKMLKLYAEDYSVTMTHVVVDCVARRLKRHGYWPVGIDKERNERRRLGRLKRMSEASKKKRAERRDGEGPSGTTAQQPKHPKRNGGGGRSIGGVNVDRPIGQTRKGGSSYPY